MIKLPMVCHARNQVGADFLVWLDLIIILLDNCIVFLDNRRRKMELRQALFKAIARAELSAKELGERSKVTPTQISRFRNGKDVSSSTLQRLIDALPEDAYRYFYFLLTPDPATDDEITEQLFELVSQLRQNRHFRDPTRSGKDALLCS